MLVLMWFAYRSSRSGTSYTSREQPALAAIPPNESVSQSTQHKYTNIETSDQARSQQGDYVSEEFTGQTSTQGHSYNNVKTKDRTISQQGNMYDASIFWDQEDSDSSDYTGRLFGPAHDYRDVKPVPSGELKVQTHETRMAGWSSEFANPKLHTSRMSVPAETASKEVRRSDQEILDEEGMDAEQKDSEDIPITQESQESRFAHDLFLSKAAYCIRRSLSATSCGRKLLRSLRPNVGIGLKRIEWSSASGMPMYGDFPAEDSMSIMGLQGLEAQLKTAAAAVNDPPGAQGIINPTQKPTLRPAASASRDTGDRSLEDYSQISNSFHQKADIRVVQPNHRLFFELCVNIGRRCTILEEIMIRNNQKHCPIDCDRMFFGKLLFLLASIASLLKVDREIE